MKKGTENSHFSPKKEGFSDFLFFLDAAHKTRADSAGHLITRPIRSFKIKEILGGRGQKSRLDLFITVAISIGSKDEEAFMKHFLLVMFHVLVPHHSEKNTCYFRGLGFREWPVLRSELVGRSWLRPKHTFFMET